MDFNRIRRNAGLASVLLLASCAKTCDQTKAQGGFFTSSKAPYVVIKQSGGTITDVYKLEDAIIQSEAGSDGWLFLDQNNRPVHIGGDMKSIRFNSTNDSLWSQYMEYHMEHDSLTYQQRIAQSRR
jgi:hypothetical protein